MNLKSLCNKYSDKLELLNEKVGLTEKVHHFHPVNIDIDYEFIGYDAYHTGPLFFTGIWPYRFTCTKVISVEVVNTFRLDPDFCNSDAYLEIKEKYPKKLFRGIPDTMFLSKVVDIYKENKENSIYDLFYDSLISQEELKSSHSNAYLYTFKIQGIDNFKKEIHYVGSYNSGDYDHHAISEFIAHTVWTQSTNPTEFYKKLLTDAYIHLLEGNFNMAYFNTFIAFESFVNSKLKKSNSKKTLKNKVDTVFSVAQDSPDSQVFEEIKNSYSIYYQTRNSIAHGSKVEVPESNALEVYTFTILSVLSCEYQLLSPHELISHLK